MCATWVPQIIGAVPEIQHGESRVTTEGVYSPNMSIGAECSKLRQHMPAIFALCRAQLLLLVVTRSRDLSRECHVTKHKTPAKSNFPLSNFENSGTIQFSSSSSTSRGLCPKNFEKILYDHIWANAPILIDFSP